MIKVFAIIGIIGGMLCAVADLLLDLKGDDNQKLGKMKMIDSKWKVMSHGRFVWSDILAMFAVPMYSCGFVALMMQLYKVKVELAMGMTIMFLCGAMGGFMIHTFLCMMPTIYQKIIEKADFEIAEDVIEGVFRQIYVPFFVLYSMLVIVPAFIVMGLIAFGILELPLWCIILNPLCFQLIGLLFRATGLKIFVDAPSCCAASLGLAMYGVLALMLI
ncbi:DUF6796 family protein [Roseburia sp. 499]|uniref:DUF6796 family protein n=1 Tax=Roseburia sp. 499 TaxID=1261634 RepID=UPI0009529B49|nr:DUF6796 family protein [Roseburia sp. 499]WVK71155.1 DUF6796 family protein [Roseburia sp. 499]